MLIDHRPEPAHLRSRVGDWEGDLITGPASRSAIGTVVCRRSRYVKLIHLPGRRTADELIDAITTAMADIPAAARLTLTWDQGSGMAGHDRVAELFGEGVYFAHAGNPWQRGTNENTNGLLRQHFPQGTEPAPLHHRGSASRRGRLNHRPRKTLHGTHRRRSWPPS